MDKGGGCLVGQSPDWSIRKPASERSGSAADLSIRAAGPTGQLGSQWTKGVATRERVGYGIEATARDA
jgi:hypothetical protein